MGEALKDRWSIPATVVANEFIDTYMASANGEYVKVYLYVLRHQGEKITLEQIADFMGGTESDVRRALSYWKKLGILGETEEEEQPVIQSEEKKENEERPRYSAGQVNKLAEDEEFSQLIYIAQKYLNRAFTARDCQVFAYLYDSLGMKSEVLEYLVEYCAQNGHTSVRYLETVALSWHERGITTAQQARDYSASYTKDSFAVMKAFGLNDRKPAAAEQKILDKWFKEYGFSREIVLEACSRTITAIHNPSFQYADKILTEWSKVGVKRMEDIEALDARRFAYSQEQIQAKERRLHTYAAAGQAARQEASGRKGAPNQFHNFKQRDTDYDALVLKQVKEWVGSSPGQL